MKREVHSLLRSGIDRRRFVQGVGAFAALGWGSAIVRCLSAGAEPAGEAATPFFKTRGLVLTVKDLCEVGWPEIAKQAGLNSIGTHIFPSEVSEFIRSDKGQRFLDECRQLGIQVEHELHAMQELLPRSLFARNPDMFRMNDEGQRVEDCNCCVHSKEGLEVICENAVKYSRTLRPTTGRYYYWIDDGRPMCQCPQCRIYSESDQALILENAMIKALSREDPTASLAHLAYAGTLAAPQQVKPEPGVFLEFAPFHRSWAHPLKQTEVVGCGEIPHGKTLEHLDANLEVFPKKTAQALDYWLDVSLFSDWKRPAKQLPWNPDVFRSDLDTYAKRGIRHITSFAAWIDGDYVKRFGPPDFVKEYGDIFLAYGTESGR